jgi:hypothetical protein
MTLASAQADVHAAVRNPCPAGEMEHACHHKYRHLLDRGCMRFRRALLNSETVGNLLVEKPSASHARTRYDCLAKRARRAARSAGADMTVAGAVARCGAACCTFVRWQPGAGLLWRENDHPLLVEEHRRAGLF